MKTINSLLTGLLIVPFMVGCGSSDALKDYKDVKGSAPTGEKPKTQNALSSNPERYFSLRVLDSEGDSFANLEQGKPANIRFKVFVNHPGIKAYDVQLGEFPQADAPTLQKNGDGTYSLIWTPQMGTVSSGDSKQFKLPIQVYPVAPSDVEISKAASPFNVLLEVRRTAHEPKIESYSGLASITEGVASKMTVIVDDPGTASDAIATPQIVIIDFPYTNKEAYRADGSPYVFRDGVEKLSGTKWKFNLTIYAQSLPLGKDRVGRDVPNGKSVKVCFYMRALGVTNRLSGSTEVCTDGLYAAQPPAVDLNTGASNEIKAGVETTMTLTVKAENPQSQVEVKNSAKQIAKLTGTKSIECSPQDGTPSNNRTCVIKWKPACVKNPTNVSLSITADSTLNGKAKSTTVTKEFTVTPNPEACAATGGR